MRLSILMPSIRTEKLQNVYDSIVNSFSGEFEIIIVGVNKFNTPIPLKAIDRGIWTFIPSFRSPNAAQQIALLNARYEMISFCADDGEYLPKALDKAFELLNDDYKTIIIGKYLEGDKPHPDMLKEDYYKFGYHKSYRLKGIPQDCLIFNCGIISRKFILKLGGYDAEYFDCTTIGHADLSIRAYNAGAKMILMDEPLFKCSHQPGKTGDHAPIDRAMKNDLFELKQTYSLPHKRIVIPLDNWKNTEEKWKERFK